MNVKSVYCLGLITGEQGNIEVYLDVTSEFMDLMRTFSVET